MKIYEVLLKDGEVYSYILELTVTYEINGGEPAEIKKYYLLDINNNINNELGRIASIGTLVEFFDSFNMSVREVLEKEKIDKINKIINEKMNNKNNKKNFYNDNSEIKKITPYSIFINEFVTKELDNFFKDNKVVKEYKLNKTDYELLEKDIKSNK